MKPKTIEDLVEEESQWIFDSDKWKKIQKKHTPSLLQKTVRRIRGIKEAPGVEEIEESLKKVIHFDKRYAITTADTFRVIWADQQSKKGQKVNREKFEEKEADLFSKWALDSRELYECMLYFAASESDSSFVADVFDHIQNIFTLDSPSNLEVSKRMITYARARGKESFDLVKQVEHMARGEIKHSLSWLDLIERERNPVREKYLLWGSLKAVGQNLTIAPRELDHFTKVIKERRIPFDKQTEELIKRYRNDFREEVLATLVMRHFCPNSNIDHSNHPSWRSWRSYRTNEFVWIMNNINPEVYSINGKIDRELFGSVARNALEVVKNNVKDGKHSSGNFSLEGSTFCINTNTVLKCPDYVELKKRFARKRDYIGGRHKHAKLVDALNAHVIYSKHANWWEYNEERIKKDVAETLGPLNRVLKSKAFRKLSTWKSRDKKRKSYRLDEELIFNIWDVLRKVDEKRLIKFFKVANEKNYTIRPILEGFEKNHRDKNYNRLIAEIIDFLTAVKDKKMADTFTERAGFRFDEGGFFYFVSKLDLDPFRVNGEITDGIEVFLRNSIIGDYESERLYTKNINTIISDNKVRDRINAGVFDDKSAIALMNLVGHNSYIFSDFVKEISIMVFQKEKSPDKINTIKKGIFKAKKLSSLREFYSKGKVSPSKYNLLEKLAGVGKFFFEDLENELKGLITGEDSLAKYNQLTSYLESNEKKKKKKPKYVRILEDIVDGKKKPIKINVFTTNMQKLGQRIEQLKIDAINKALTEIYASSLIKILGKEHEKKVREWANQKNRNIEDISNAVMMYHFVKTNKSHLKTLLYNTVIEGNPNKQLLEEKANVEFREEMESKGINMDPWLDGYKLKIQLRNDLIDKLKDTEKNISENIHYCLRDIIENLKKVKGKLKGNISYFSGLNLSSLEDVEKCRDELIKKRHELSTLDIKDESYQDFKTALFHLSNLIKFPVEYRDMQEDVELKGKADVYIERDPIKILQMGNYFSDSCLALSKENNWSTVSNAVDANNAVVYVRYNGKVVGRKLLKLDNKGKIIQHRVYTNNISLNMDLLTNMFVKNLAREMKTRVGEGKNFKPTLVAEKWYDDGQKSLEYLFKSKAS